MEKSLPCRTLRNAVEMGLVNCPNASVKYIKSRETSTIPRPGSGAFGYAVNVGMDLGAL